MFLDVVQLYLLRFYTKDEKPLILPLVYFIRDTPLAFRYPRSVHNKLMTH